MLRIDRTAAIFLALVGLSACAPTQLAVTAVKELSKPSQDSSKTTPTSSKTAAKNLPGGNVGKVPIGPGGIYKVGNPYTINGVRYVPKVDLNYDQTGIASWYGKKFHGKRTANGEIYNMNLLTAAHKTLPLPTYVRVTNLENGRALVLRINDRGPFVNERIIDLSRRGAQLLGFEMQGTAKVRVRVLGGSEEDFVATKPVTPKEERNAVRAVPIRAVESKKLEVPTDVKPSPDRQLSLAPPPAVSLEAVKENKLFVQVGSFILFENANRLGARLSPYGPVSISSTIVRGEEFFRVRLGPLSEVGVADTTLSNIISAGHPEARIIVD